MVEDSTPYEVVVVGAGAAGLMAAAVAGERGRKVLLLEKNPRAGTKILMSGGTRCNITHAATPKQIVAAFQQQHLLQGKFLNSALAALSPDKLVQIFHEEGVATKMEPGGKIFPVSNRAVDVLNALLARTRRSGVQISLREPLVDVEFEKSLGQFRLSTPDRTVLCANLILTTGGKSYPGSGTTGDGYAWLKKLGHTIVPPRPALTPVTTSATWVRDLKGITIADVGLHLTTSENPNDRKYRIDQRRGSFLFTHFGLSGPSPLDISRSITGHPAPNQLKLACDFLPDIREDQLRQQWRDRFRSQGKRTVLSLLAEIPLPKRLLTHLCAMSEIDGDQRAAELSKDKLLRLVHAVKSNVISVHGTRGFKKAEVTAGGLSLAEVDSKTMQSRVVKGLFVAGELLDLDGPIGGYNFQAAFSTAWLAGLHA